MKKEAVAVSQDLKALAKDAKDLLAATSDVAEGKVVQARKRLAVAIEKGRGGLWQMQNKVVESAKATDELIHGYPYHAIGVALGTGALVGFLLTRRG